MEGIFWPSEWRFLPEALSGFRGTILVFAPGDRGKSTLVRLLYTLFLEEGRRVGWIDADLGQSTIGPPTTVGLLVSRGKEATFEERLFTPHFRFVGDTTPEREIVATACYTADLVHFALSRCDVAIGEKEEFALWRRFLDDRLLLLPVSEKAVEKRYEFRRGYRRQLFARYFSRGKLLTFPLDALRFSLPCYPYFFEPCLYEEEGVCSFSVRGEQWRFSPEGPALFLESRGQEVFLPGMLCGIFSANGKELGLGILKGVDLARKTLTVWGVRVNPEKPAIVVPGSLRVDESGEERGRCVLFPSPLSPQKW
jgi:polynucleotide 5'-kinase involved in rRNA processing